jgi:gliding motility associated protien GldN
LIAKNKTQQMKNNFLVLVLLLLFIAIGGNAQPVTSSAPRDGVVDKSEKVDKKPVAYPWIRKADYIWDKRVWRVIDMREKMNQPMYYPEVPHNNWRSFMTIILDAVKETTLTAYDATSPTDEFILPISYKELMAKVETADSSKQQRPYPPYEFFDTVIYKKLEVADIKKIRIKEDWFFDKQRSMLEVRIIGICPVIDKFNEDGSYRGANALFWIYFPEARPILAKNDVFNRFNGAARMTYDDFFWKRMFSSYIYKVDNQYDRNINEYATGMDAILESERIKEDLFNFEQQLWEY